jgi:hypothetical protein
MVEASIKAVPTQGKSDKPPTEEITDGMMVLVIIPSIAAKNITNKMAMVTTFCRESSLSLSGWSSINKAFFKMQLLLLPILSSEILFMDVS